MSYEVTYSGVTDREVGCHAKSRPSVPAPIRRTAVSTLAGRDGSYYDTDGMFEDIVIPVSFMFSDHNRDHWHQNYRAIKEWLLSGDNGDLKFSDDAGFHYRVKSVQITSTERIAWTIGQVDAQFTCDPYTYLDNGDTPVAFSAILQNNYSLCMPTYRVSGNGLFTLTVNGYDFTGTINGTMDIDTERMLAIQNGSEWVNTTVTGDYSKLWLKPGANDMSITSGFTCQITPHWRCV